MNRLMLCGLAAGLSLFACRVDTGGAPCTSDVHCPDGQRCTDGRCETGERTGMDTACTSDEACTARLAAVMTFPDGCAEAHCNTGLCEYASRDLDADGERAANCTAMGLSVITGPDCVDSDPNSKAGSMRPCLSSEDGGALFPTGTPVGRCVAPMQICDPGGNGQLGTCTGGVLPIERDCASTADNDCNGNPDSQDCGCEIGTTRACYTGPSGTEGVGLCISGAQSCIALDAGLNGWTTCGGDALPQAVNCSSHDDNNCNGQPDTDDCGCEVGTNRPCYPDDAGTVGVGRCTAGAQACDLVDAGLAAWGMCNGAVLPTAVNCSSGDDFDCNGEADGVQCGCQVGTSAPCYSGPAGTENVGQCHAGTKVCGQLDAGVADYGACSGQVLPGALDCSTSTADRNCNGQVDSIDCGCQLGATRACYTGPPGTQNVGTCHGGSQTCTSTGASSTGWGACDNQVIPTTRNCSSSTADADCNGQADVTACGCQVGSTRGCYTGPAGTQNVGICRGGSNTCVSTGTGTAAWNTTCSGQTTPAARDTCNAGEDNNCNGTPADSQSCACINGTSTSAGCSGTCNPGTRYCSSGAWGSCQGSTTRYCNPGQTRTCSSGILGCSAAESCNGCNWSGTCSITSCIEVPAVYNGPGNDCTRGCAGGVFGNVCMSDCSFSCPSGTTRSSIDIGPGSPSYNCNWSVNSIAPHPGNSGWWDGNASNPSISTRIGVPAVQGIDCHWVTYCRGPR